LKINLHVIKQLLVQYNQGHANYVVKKKPMMCEDVVPNFTGRGKLVSIYDYIFYDTINIITIHLSLIS